MTDGDDYGKGSRWVTAIKKCLEDVLFSFSPLFFSLSFSLSHLNSARLEQQPEMKEA